MNWKDLVFPERIAALPKTERGIPIPFFVAYVNGVPDLRFSSPQKQLACAREKVCWVCGQKLGAFAAFIGGPISGRTLCFSDGPMHRECAEFSLKHCPFLATPALGYSKHDVPTTVKVPTGHSGARSPYQTLTITKRWEAISLSPSEIGFRALNPHDQSKWKEGVPYNDNPDL